MRTFFGRKKEEYRYSVTGTIAFALASAETPEDLATLRAVITHANLFYPWRSKWESRCEEMPHLCKGRISFSGSKKVCWFEINPPYALTKNEIYAYEKYLDGIAQALSRWHIRLNGVREVSSSIKIISVLRAYPVTFKGQPA